MGIRFYCPNGHKLNVKIFQAGRKGICPYCGAKFLIPTQNTRKSSNEARAALRSMTVASSSISPSTAGSAINPTTPPLTGAQAAPVAASSVDPLTEAGDVVWYVRPSSGGQYGPATGNIMRQWLAEGRISSDTLVWREGWRDWQHASAIFPQLHQNDSMAETIKEDDPFARPISPLINPPNSRLDPQKMRILVIILAILATIILTSVFIWAITRESSSATHTLNTPSTSLKLRDTLSPDRLL